MTHAEAIQKNNDVLLRCTTINLHVIDFLRAEDILDDAQESDLRAKKSHLKQRILLYQWLKEVSSDKYESFLQVMKDAEQEHVANLLTGSTEDEYLPLSDERHRRLMKIRHKMAYVTRIDNEVIAELRGAKAISMTDAEEIRAETVDYAKVSTLIGSIMRRSNYSYNRFHEVLRKTLQKAAAEYLNEGEMPAVHINNNRPDLDGRLSHALNGVIRNRNTDDTEIQSLVGEMDGLGLNPVKAIPGQSIVIFIYCKTVQNAVNFTQLFNSGRLQHILERIFNKLLLAIEPHNTKTLDSLINLEDEEVTTLESYTGVEDWMREDQKRPTALRKLHVCEATTQTDEASLMKTITGGLPEKYKSDPTLIRTIQMEAKKIGRNSIHGMAILDKELFITSESSKEVVVYDSMTFSFNRRWNLTELTRLIDIASCNKNKCLYILDSERLSKIIEIWRVNSNGKLINKWSTEPVYGYGLSVTNESNVILAGRSRNRIFEYSPDGQLIHEIKLSYNICNPWHAIELASGQFVISHGCHRCGSQHVSIVDKYEGIMKSFGVFTINEYMHQDPTYLFVDGNGFVMVADREKGQVVLLDSDLEFKRNILSHGLEYPRRILLDESNGRLFVTDGTRRNVNKILVFQF